MATAMHTYIHALQLNGRADGRWAPRHQDRGAQRPWATLNYICATLGSKRHQGHRRARGWIEREGDQRNRGVQEGPKRRGGPENTTGRSERAATPRKASPAQPYQPPLSPIQSAPPTTGVFYAYFYNHVHRHRLQKLLYLPTGIINHSWTKWLF